MLNRLFVLCVLLGLGALPIWSLKPIWMERGEHRQLTWEEFVDMVKHRPMTEKYEFVRDNYLRGYELARKELEEMENLDSRNKLALAIFQLVIQMEMRDTEEDVRRLLSMLPICFPLPIGCIDSDDAGLRPI